MQKVLGVSTDQKFIILYLEQAVGSATRLSFSLSRDGTKFDHPAPLPKAAETRLKKISGRILSLRFSPGAKKSPVTILGSGESGNNLYQTAFEDSSSSEPGFTPIKPIAAIHETAVLLSPDSASRLLFFGDKNINLAVAAARGPWKIFPRPLLSPRSDFFDHGDLQVGQARIMEQGILLTYYCRKPDASDEVLAVGAALFDRQNPEKIIWRSDFPLWHAHPDKKMRGIGEADFKGEHLFFLQDEFGNIYSVRLPLWNLFAQAKTHTRKPRLDRAHNNPVLGPRPDHDWESKAAFNPAAFSAHGRVHLIYRAIGNDDISSFGYASSQDGIHFDERLDYPVYSPRRDFEGQSLKRIPRPSSPYASGGSGIGGCEDPRVSLIDETLYMTYVAFDGWRPPRVALTSISLEDFLNHRWNWEEPVLISPYLPNEGNKNSCILNEKINGKYVIFHRIWPDILIDYSETLKFNGKNKFLSKKGHAKIPPRQTHWDSRKVGIGATPIKTSSGWLLIYQAVGHQDPSKYKVGAMLLDLQDPSKVIARSNSPVLEPEAWYENEGWKYGVVYPCGAAVLGDDLLVYYGGSDTYTCVAKANLPDFLSHLLTHKPATLDPVAL